MPFPEGSGDLPFVSCGRGPHRPLLSPSSASGLAIRGAPKTSPVE